MPQSNPFNRIQIPKLKIHWTRELDGLLPHKELREILADDEDMFWGTLAIKGYHYALDVGWYGGRRRNAAFGIKLIGDCDWENPIHSLRVTTLEELCWVFDFESQYLTALQQMSLMNHSNLPELPDSIWAILNDKIVSPIPKPEPITVPHINSDCDDLDEELFCATVQIAGNTYSLSLYWHREFRLGGYFEVYLKTQNPLNQTPEFIFRAFNVEELTPILTFCIDSLRHWQMKN